MENCMQTKIITIKKKKSLLAPTVYVTVCILTFQKEH